MKCAYGRPDISRPQVFPPQNPCGGMSVHAAVAQNRFRRKALGHKLIQIACIDVG
jgi:hypothetical protein